MAAEHRPRPLRRPAGRYSVRYLAETLAGGLLEKLAQFQRDTQAELLRHELPATADGAAEAEEDAEDFPLPPEPDHDPRQGLADWLDLQRFVVLRVREDVAFPDLTHVDTAAYLADRPAFREVLSLPEVRLAYGSGRKRATVTAEDLSAVDAPRVVTQAASRAVFEDEARYGGLASRSCQDKNERCWTVFGRVKVEPLGEPACLCDRGADVLAALARAADAVGVVLPPAYVAS